MKKVNHIVVKEKCVFIITIGLIVLMLSGCGAQTSSKPAEISSASQASTPHNESSEAPTYERKLEKTVVEDDNVNEIIEYKITLEDGTVHEFRVTYIDELIPVIKLMLENGFSREEIYNEALHGAYEYERIPMNEFDLEGVESYYFESVELDGGRIAYYAPNELEKEWLMPFSSRMTLQGIRKLMACNADDATVFEQAVSLIIFCEEIIENKRVENPLDPFEYRGEIYDLSDFNSAINLITILNSELNNEGPIAAILKYRKSEITKDELKDAFENLEESYEKYVVYKEIREIDAEAHSNTLLENYNGERQIVEGFLSKNNDKERYAVLSVGFYKDMSEYALDSEEKCENVLYLLSTYANTRDIISSVVVYDVCTIIAANQDNINEGTDFNLNFDYGRVNNPFLIK